MPFRTVFVAAVFALSASGSAQHETAPTIAAPAAERLVVHEPGLYPEDLEWDGVRRRFLVSSAATGLITSVGDNGAAQPFSSGTEITSALGMHLDKPRSRLLVAGADFAAVSEPGRTGEAKLAAYDLASGQRAYLVDLAGLRPRERHLANDVTTGPDGTAYVTDSLAPLIYRVTPTGEASVLVDDERLRSGGGQLGLNGIVYHPDGYLLVAMATTLYRVPLDAPANLTEVRLPEQVALDGLDLRPNGQLIATAPFMPAVLELSSGDGWRSARIVGRVRVLSPEAGPITNTTWRDGILYTINGRLSALQGGEPRVRTFEIFRVDLPSTLRR